MACETQTDKPIQLIQPHPTATPQELHDQERRCGNDCRNCPCRKREGKG